MTFKFLLNLRSQKVIPDLNSRPKSLDAGKHFRNQTVVTRTPESWPLPAACSVDEGDKWTLSDLSVPPQSAFLPAPADFSPCPR